MVLVRGGGADKKLSAFKFAFFLQSVHLLLHPQLRLVHYLQQIAMRELL